MPRSLSWKVGSSVSVPEDAEDGVLGSEAERGAAARKGSGNGKTPSVNQHSRELPKTGPQLHLILGNNMFKKILGCDRPHALPGRSGGTTEAGSQGLGAVRMAEAVALVQHFPQMFYVCSRTRRKLAEDHI